MTSRTSALTARLLSLAAAAALSACADEGGDGAQEPELGAPASSSLYAVFTSLSGPDGDTSYLAITESLDEGVEVRTDTSLETPGASRFYAPEGGGFFALGSNEDFTITRYDVGRKGQVEETGRLSFASQGLTRLHYRAVFLSETKAYYIDHTQGQIVVWNPKEMVIERSLRLPDELVDGFQGYTTVLPYFRYPVVEGRLFIPVAWNDFANGKSRDVTGLVVVDTDSDEVVSYDETARCASATELAFDDNGDVYFGTNVNQPYYGAAHDPELRAQTRAGCILRIRAGESEFDPEYRLDLGEAIGDVTSMGLADGARPGLAYVQAIDEDRLAWADVTDEDTFWESPVWSWWQVDLRSGSAERDPGIEASAPYMTSYQVDDRRYISRQLGDNESHLIELRANGEHRGSLKSVGSIRAVARVR